MANEWKFGIWAFYCEYLKLNSIIKLAKVVVDNDYVSKSHA